MLENLNNDISWGALSSLFGFDFLSDLVDPSASGPATVFADIFGVFNSTLLAFVFVIYAFIIFVGTINSAQDGQFLGKEWDSAWVPLRSVLGVLSVIPFGSGFCFIQYLVLIAVGGGVTMANNLWSTVVNDAKDDNSVPIIPSYITTQIKNDFALYMLSGRTNTVLESLPACSDQNADSMSVCQESNDAQQNDIYKTYQINLTMPMTDSAMMQFSNVLLNPRNETINMSAPKEGQLETQKVNPFLVDSLWQGFIKSGMVSFSYLSNDKSQYNQAKILNTTQHGTFKVLNFDLAHQLCEGDSSNAKDYCNAMDQVKIFASGHSDFNAVYQYGLSGNDEYLYDSNQDFLTSIADLTKYITDKLKDGDFQSTSEINTDKGWLTAATQYLQFDKLMQQNLEHLMNRFSSFQSLYENIYSNIFSINYTNMTLRAYYQSIPVNHNEEKPQEDDIFYYNTVSSNGVSKTTPSITSAKDYLYTLSGYNISPGDGVSGNVIASDLSSMRRMYHILFALTNSGTKIVKGTSNLTNDQATDQLLFDGMSYTYSQYLSIMNSVMQTQFMQSVGEILEQYTNNNGSIKMVLPNYASQSISSYQRFLLDSSPDTLKAVYDKLKLWVSDQNNPEIQNIVNAIRNQLTKLAQQASDNLALLAYFQANGVNFMANSSAQGGGSITGNIIYKYLNVLGISSAQTDGVFNEIWSLGASHGSGFVSQSVSMLQNVQTVGIDIITQMIGSIGSVIEQFNHEIKSIILYEQINAGITAGLKTAAAAAAAASWPGTNGVYYVADTAANLTTASLSVPILLKSINLFHELAWLPIFIFIFGSLFTVGVLFSLFVPMIPYVLFWVGAISWLLLVIEALIAAPFMGLGIVYPEGHKVFGKSQPGIAMMINLMFRPMLMVIGLLGAILLTYTVVSLSAAGFHQVADFVLLQVRPDKDNVSLVAGVMGALMVLMYASFMVLVFTKCFSLIYTLPDKVLSWIGGQPVSQGGEQEMGELKSGVSQSASGLSQSMGEHAKEHVTSGKGIASDTAAAGQKFSGVNVENTGKASNAIKSKLSRSPGVK
ncbi:MULTISPECIES: DotA/TraY family protein [Cysteiniphilum]|uniref:DotA/TraY family protein n=1 Tax=Cysteiniphilum TaxID=2056696 RepID=UPI00177BAF6C|nr:MULTISPECIES: DotA/TraY family protein [Cysteiniphilum]